MAMRVALALTVPAPDADPAAAWNDVTATSATVAAPDTDAAASFTRTADTDTLAAPETEAVTSKIEVPGDEKGACENEEDANIYLVQRIGPVVDRCVSCRVSI